MSMTLMTLLVALLVPQQIETAPAATSMKADVDRLVRAAEKLSGTWPSQAPPPIPEVSLVARHGAGVAPLLAALLSDDPDVENDRKHWKVQQQVTRLPSFPSALRGLDTRRTLPLLADIGALLRDLACQGVSIVVISSDMAEVLLLSDRVAVMCEGRFTGVLERQDCTEPRIMALAVASGA